VARAVAASAAIPFAFEWMPLEVPGRRMGIVVDGGVAANFPTFVFADTSFRQWVGLPSPVHKRTPRPRTPRPPTRPPLPRVVHSDTMNGLMNDSMNEPEDDFAALFEASLQAKPLARGQTVEGTVVGIGDEVALVDVGGKSEAVLDLAELRNDDGSLEVAVGDRIQATVVSTAGGVTLSRRLARRAATDRQIQEAFHAGLPVEGTVQGVVKGGYEVRVGHSRAFCPFSQIDVARTEDPHAHVGCAYTFRIVEYGEGGRNLVVLRRALVEEEQEARAAEIRRAAVPGAVVTGRVVSVRDFGAFVDLGAGVQGLLHVSEMGWSRVADASHAVSAGDEITVKVLRVDEGTDRIALGLKQLAEDPWSKVPTSYEVGQVRTGRVTRLAEFGAFVELEPGIEGLAHASTFEAGGRAGDWKGQVSVGTTGPFEILSIDLARRRIGVAPVPEGSTRAARVVRGEPSGPGSDERDADDAGATERLGSLADKLRGALKRPE
jgi:small subunit ribosomal protein S1